MTLRQIALLAVVAVASLSGAAMASGGEGHGVGFVVVDEEGHPQLHVGLFETEEEAEARAHALGEHFHVVAVATNPEHGQSSLFKVEPGTSLWLLITFGILMGVLYRYAWPALLAGLAAREQSIVEAVQSAERTNAEAAALLAQYEQKLATARDEVQAIIDEGKRDATKVKEVMLEEARKDAEQVKVRARRELEMAEKSMIKDIYAKMAVLSTDIASRVIERELDPKEHERLVEDSIAKFEGA